MPPSNRGTGRDRPGWPVRTGGWPQLAGAARWVGARRSFGVPRSAACRVRTPLAEAVRSRPRPGGSVCGPGSRELRSSAAHCVPAMLPTSGSPAMWERRPTSPALSLWCIPRSPPPPLPAQLPVPRAAGSRFASGQITTVLIVDGGRIVDSGRLQPACPDSLPMIDGRPTCQASRHPGITAHTMMTILRADTPRRIVVSPSGMRSSPRPMTCGCGAGRKAPEASAGGRNAS